MMMAMEMVFSQEGTLHHFHSDGNRRGGLEKLDLFKKCSQAANLMSHFLYSLLSV